MKIGEREYKRVYVYDIETLKTMFYVAFLEFEGERIKEFEISEDRNDLVDLIKFYNSRNIDFGVGFNNLGFDGQVLQFIVDSYEKWVADWGYIEICEAIRKFVDGIIEGQKYKVRLPYYESQMDVLQLDCRTILGLDNKARAISLKGCEIELDMDEVEEMPISHTQATLTRAERELIRSYCKVDIKATKKLFKLVLGDTEHELYKGKNCLELRNDIEQEFGLRCLNLSDIRIGDELLKLEYSRSTKQNIKDLPKKGTFRKYVKLKDCIPSTIEFKTDKLKALLEKLKSTTLDLAQEEKWEEHITIGKTKYIQSMGGLHSVNKNSIWKSSDYYKIITKDVSSMYPAIICNNRYKPAHLREDLIDVYSNTYKKRLELKPLSKTDVRIKGICEALKLVLNVPFGLMGMQDSWLYDMKSLLSVTLTGQYSLLMLIEELELAGITVLSTNTDGIECIVPIGLETKYREICKAWEKRLSCQLEYDEYSKIAMVNINNYIAITKSGDIKKKGLFSTTTEVHKNKSRRVVARALEEYFINGANPIDYIKSYPNILDFCIRSRCSASTDNILELEYPDGGRPTEKKGKIMRWYVCTEEGLPELYKRGTGTTGKPMNTNQLAPDELGVKRIKEFNIKTKGPYNIDYSHYIYSCLKIIAGLEKNKKDEEFVNSIINPNQLKLL